MQQAEQGVGDDKPPDRVADALLEESPEEDLLRKRHNEELKDRGGGHRQRFLRGAAWRALVAHVHSLEIHPDLAQGASRTLKSLSVTNVTVETVDATILDESGLYDAIVLTASLPVYDPRFQRALRRGGRLFAVVGTVPVMEARLVTRASDDQWVTEVLFETVIPPLINAAVPDAFTL